ncbi:pyridoxal phosphate phosphatase PHOSPHO2-like [Kogia breviceps]|uniref:pyridoxal phosphate phosphatase PHOSPHO2-like n=1 Tax=Kogia breviceps TaxID=27615 RepID=UPI0027954534|nr:pyridoxal phosphate phosphatase PHOSPHO2-like [Kogia breviceps]
MKILLVFDFDNIIIDDNSDTWIVQCAPEKEVPIELQDSYEKGLWTEFMGRVFKYLGDEGVREDEMKRAMVSMPFTPGVVELLNFIRKYKDKFDWIIISDSNSVFIDRVLEATNFHDVFDKVFTNPAAFYGNGRLTVENYHAHSCTRCPQSRCKNVVLVEFVGKQLQRGVNYTLIVYIGDGRNNVCPVTFLKKNDVAMPQKGYTLQKTLSKMS